MERYETAGSKVYEIKRHMRGPMADYEVRVKEKDFLDGWNGILVYAGAYGECRRYVEEARREARA